MLARRVTQGLGMTEGGEEGGVGCIGRDGCGKGQAHRSGAASNMQSRDAFLSHSLGMSESSPPSFT